MARMKEGKDRALNEYWPHLRDNVSSETFKITMRDGAEIDIRAYTPKAKSPLTGERPVVYT
jgi:predicted acyl esterase